jgi:Fur family ferric uptake transcriptional regulator
MSYSTKQRQAVLACLSGRRGELLSAAELTQILRQAGSPVGLATIYRHLTRLEEAGFVHRVNTPEGAFYRYCEEESSGGRECFLLRCESCGQILHLDCSHLRALYEHLERDHHFIVNPRETVFSGLCEACARRGKEALHEQP